MVTASKHRFHKCPKSLFVILAIAWTTYLSFVVSAYYLQKSHNILLVEKKLQTINNFMRSVNGNDSIKVLEAQNLFIEDENNTFPNHVCMTIYKSDGAISITTANGATDISPRTPKNLPMEFQDALKYGFGFNQCSIDKNSGEKSYMAVSYSRNDGVFIVTSIPYEDEYEDESLKKPIFITNILFLIVLLVISIVVVMMYRRYNRDLYALYRLSDDLNNDIVADDKFRFSSKRILEIAKNIKFLYKSKSQIVENYNEEKEAALAEEKEKLKSKRVLSNNLNHEVKTPIGIIQGYLDTLINHPDISPEMRKSFLQKCVSNANRLQNMVYNITMITRIEDGSNSISMEDVNMHEMTELVKEDMKFYLEENGISFSIRISPDIYVLSNPSIIYNILNNLVKNSCLHSHGTEIVFEEVDENARYHFFTYYDNGVGVAENHLPHLFERFFRIEKEGRITGGTGLGLAIVKESVNPSGGDVVVENRQGGGLKFSFYLPKA